MNIQQFLQRLSAVPPPLSAGELKNLEQFTDQYPWCGIAQQLLLEAAWQSGEKHSSRQIVKAAIYVTDRERLSQRLEYISTQPTAPEIIARPEEDIEFIPDKNTPAQKPAPKPAAPTKKPEVKVVHHHPGDYFGSENIDTQLSKSDPISRFLIEKPQLRPVASALSEVDIPDHAQVTVTPQNFDDIVTETLAKIYEDQGLASLAMATYEKLSLLEPKKSTYFASRMQNLKFKLKS